MPACRYCKKEMSDKHHDKVYHCKDQEHFVDSAFAKGVEERLHDGTCDCLGSAKAGYGKSGCQTLAVFKPEHQGLHGRKITGAKTDSHDEAIAYIDAQQRYETSRMCAAVSDKETGTGHTCCKADRSDQ